MGPDYTRPQTDVEDRFRMAEGPPDLPSLANLAWMDLLRDEQLQQLIRTALEHNWDLQRAVASIDEFRARASFGVFGAGLAAPLLNAQVLEFQQEAVEAQSKQALAQYQQAVLTAFREVEDALIAVRTARLQSDAQQQQVTALQSALKLAELRYRGELANYLDVLVARRSLFEAELAWTSTRRLLLASVVHLYKALGGGWSPDMQWAEDAKKG